MDQACHALEGEERPVEQGVVIPAQGVDLQDREGELDQPGGQVELFARHVGIHGLFQQNPAPAKAEVVIEIKSDHQNPVGIIRCHSV